MPRFFKGPTARPVRLVLIIDASGSMVPYADLVQTGITGFLTRLAATSVDYRITLVQFGDSVRVDCRAQPIAETHFYYADLGGTALYDGIGTALQGEERNLDPTVAFIFSDGLENMSRTYTQAMVYALIKGCLMAGNWSFVWMNMQGAESPQAKRLEIESLDFQQKDIVEVMATMAERLAASVGRMRMQGAQHVDVAALLGRAGQ